MQNTLESEMSLNSVSNKERANSLNLINADGSSLVLCSVPAETMYGFSIFWGGNHGNMGKFKISQNGESLATQALALIPVDNVHYKTAYGRLFGAAIDRELISLVSTPNAEKNMLNLHKLKRTTVITLALDDHKGDNIERFEIKADELPALIAMINANSKTFGERAVALLQLPQLEEGGFNSVFGALDAEMLGRMLQNLFITKALSTAKVLDI